MVDSQRHDATSATWRARIRCAVVAALHPGMLVEHEHDDSYACVGISEHNLSPSGDIEKYCPTVDQCSD